MKTVNTICIIDDDPIFRFGTKKMMEKAQFPLDFLVYKNGQEAYDDLAQKIEQRINLPDVILLDLNMPIMDGWQFLDEFSKILTSERIPIYIVSSSVDRRDIEKAKSYDIVINYLIKPFSVLAIKELLIDLSQQE